MTISNSNNIPRIQLNHDTLITRNPMHTLEWEGIGRGVPGGSLKGTEMPMRPSVVPQITPAYRSLVSVPRSVNTPLNGVQIRQNSGVNVGGVSGKVVKPVEIQSKKPVYGPPLPTKAQLEIIRSQKQQKTRAGSVPFKPNKDSYKPKILINGAKNIIPIQRKNKPPNEPVSCVLTIRSKYDIIQHVEQFNNDGRKIREPKAENYLRLTAKLETNRIGSRLSAKIIIGNTDVGTVSSSTKTNYGMNNYLNVKLDGTKSIPSEQLTRDYLNKHKILFDTYVNQGLSLYPEVSAHCVIDGVRTSPSLRYETEIFQNGRRVQ